MATPKTVSLAHTCVATPRAHRYLAKLANLWEDEVVVGFGRDQARIDLPEGPCFLSAGPGSLAILLEAEDEARLHDMEFVIAARLELMASSEGLHIDWRRS
jgi:hypothetical protein